MGEVVKEAAGLEDFDAPDEIERKICAVLGTDGPACSTLAQLFGAAERDSSVEETFWAVRSFLEAVAETAPLAVVFDDIHWGEPTFLDLIEHITGWAREARSWCSASRGRSCWTSERAGAGLQRHDDLLEPLSDDECGDLIGNLLGRAALPDEARVRILAAAEGTPLFVEEMLSMLIDDGSLARDGDRWVATGPLVDLRVPPTIQALLAARLEQLTGDERAVIQRAAVCGKQFHVGAVAALLDGGEVQPILMSLVRRDVIRPDRSVAGGPGRVPVPPPADPRCCLRGRAEGAPCRAARAVRRLARGRRGDARRGVRGDPRLSPGTLTASSPNSDRSTTPAVSWGSSGRPLCGERPPGVGSERLSVGRDPVPPRGRPPPGGSSDRPRTLYDVGRASARCLDPRLAFAALDDAATAAGASDQRSIEWMARIGASCRR